MPLKVRVKALLNIFVVRLILLLDERNERANFTDQISFSVQSPSKNETWLLKSFPLGFSLKGYNVNFQ